MACLTILSILFFNEIIPLDFTLFGVLNRRGGCVGSAVEDKVLKLPLVQCGMKGKESKRIGQTFPFEKPGREGQIISKSQRQFKDTIFPRFQFCDKFNTQCFGMGKTSLANTFAEFLKSPTEDSKPVLTKGTDLEFTKVMQLYDGLSVDQKKEIEVQVQELPRNGSVKLVKLKMGKEEEEEDFTSSPSEPQKAGKRERFMRVFTSVFTRARTNPNQETPAPENDNKDDVQLKLVDMGGHSATVVLTTAVNSSNQNFT